MGGFTDLPKMNIHVLKQFPKSTIYCHKSTTIIVASLLGLPVSKGVREVWLAGAGSIQIFIILSAVTKLSKLKENVFSKSYNVKHSEKLMMRGKRFEVRFLGSLRLPRFSHGLGEHSSSRVLASKTLPYVVYCAHSY